MFVKEISIRILENMGQKHGHVTGLSDKKKPRTTFKCYLTNSLHNCDKYVTDNKHVHSCQERN